MKKHNKNIIVVIFTVFLIIALVCGLILSIRLYKPDIAEADKSYETISSSIYESVKWLISEPLEASQTMASDKELIELLESENEISDIEMTRKMTDYLSLMTKDTNIEYTFCASDSTKKYYSNDGLEKVINPEKDSYDKWYPAFIASEEKYSVSIDTELDDNNTWIVFVDSRIEDESGNLLGVCSAGKPVAGLQEILTDYEEKYNIKAYFVDKNGTVKIDTDFVNINNIDTSGIKYDNADNRDKAYSYIAKDGSRVVMRYVSEFGLYLVVRSK